MRATKFQRKLVRVAIAGALIAAATASMLIAMLMFLDVGLPKPRVAGVMHIESIEVAGIALRGWQMYLSYVVPAAAGLALFVCAFRSVFRAIKT